MGLLLAGCSIFSGKEVAPPAELTAIPAALPVQVLWEFDTGHDNLEQQAKLQLAAEGERLFVADAAGTVHAVNRADGKRIWQYKGKQALTAGVGVGDGLVVMATDEAEIVALNTETGALRWQVNIANEVLAIPQIRHDRVVIRTIDGEVLALNAADGQVLWRYGSSVPLLSLRGSNTPILTDDKVLIGQANGELVALELQSGAVLWKQAVAVSHSRSQLGSLVDIDAEMALADGVVYATAFQGKVVAVTEDSGTLLWGNEAVYGHTGVAVDHRQVLVTAVNDRVLALDRNNGAALWKNEQLVNRQLTAPVVMDEQIVVADFEGFVHWLAREDGHLVARIRLNRKSIRSTPLMLDQVLFVLSDNGELTALQLKPQ